jgi:hypothetical protein
MYMSIEEALAANTAAIIALTSAISAGNKPTAIESAPAAPAAKPGKKAAAANPPAVAAPVAAPPVAPAPTTSPVATAPAATATPSFKAVADALVEVVAKRNREAGIDLLAKYGAAKVPELKPEDYRAFIDDAKALLAPVATPGSDLLS